MVTLGQVLAALEALAPLRYAADWDNVGLLLEPPLAAGARGRARAVARILLAIDATDPVVREAVRRRCQLIVAYHPPIFVGLKALRASSPRTRALLRALQHEIAIYSPHTALDAAPGGVNDWLAASFGRVQAEPLRVIADAPPGVGEGRLVTLPRAVSLGLITARLKRHLRVRQLRIARSLADPRRGVRTVALAAGAGGTLLMERLARGGLDLMFTGEMRHHDVLAATEAGTHVILAEHSHTERGYLPILRRQLLRGLGPGVAVQVATSDREPLRAE